MRKNAKSLLVVLLVILLTLGGSLASFATEEAVEETIIEEAVEETIIEETVEETEEETEEVATTETVSGVELHKPHVGASSESFEKKPDNGGIEAPVVWHFVLNQLEKGTAPIELTVTINGVTYTATGNPAGNDDKEKENAKPQHFYVGTSSHGVVEGATANVGSGKLVLSHVTVTEGSNDQGNGDQGNGDQGNDDQGNNDQGNNDQDNNNLEELEEDEIPLGPVAVVIQQPTQATEEVEEFEELEEDIIPLGAIENEVIEEEVEEIILDEEIPQGPATLPQTGQLPPYLFYGLGTVISTVGLKLKRK